MDKRSLIFHGPSSLDAKDAKLQLYMKGCFVFRKPLKELTLVILDLIEQADGVQVFGCGHRQRQHISDGLVESRVGAVTERDGLIFILQEILHMAHFVVHRNQIVHVHHCALLNPKETYQTFPIKNHASKLLNIPRFYQHRSGSLHDFRRT